MSRLLFVCFHEGDAIVAASLAQALSLPFDTFSFGPPQTSHFGADRHYSTNLAEIPEADVIAEAIATVSAGYTHICATSSMASKDSIARLAGALEVPMLTDVIEVLAPNRFKRPILAGSAIVTVEISSSPIILTARGSSFPVGQIAKTTAEVVEIAVPTSGKIERIRAAERNATRPDLSQASVVVSGGKPLRTAEQFESIIGGLADALGGAVGATRAAVDEGIAANELQVGQTGKIVAPDLYIAAGISGSTQHAAGIKDSKCIVAINNDPDAAIFEIADIGLVADLFEAVPKLTQLVTEHRNSSAR